MLIARVPVGKTITMRGDGPESSDIIVRVMKIEWQQDGMPSVVLGIQAPQGTAIFREGYVRAKSGSRSA